MLARDHGVQRIRVYMDSELVVDQVNGVAAVKQDHLKELHRDARTLVALFKNIRICWVPREMNADADQLVRMLAPRHAARRRAARRRRGGPLSTISLSNRISN